MERRGRSARSVGADAARNMGLRLPTTSSPRGSLPSARTVREPVTTRQYGSRPSDQECSRISPRVLHAHASPSQSPAESEKRPDPCNTRRISDHIRSRKSRRPHSSRLPKSASSPSLVVNHFPPRAPSSHERWRFHIGRAMPDGNDSHRMEVDWNAEQFLYSLHVEHA